MEFSDLRIFLAVADMEGITRAAQELHTVQSNVSARLAALERELGAPLFRRHPRGVVLTTAGEQLLPYARQISDLMEEARRTVGHQDAVPKGPLRIGSLETTAGLRLPSILATFAADCPQVELSLTTGPTGGLIDDVLTYRLDGALVTGPVQHPELMGTSMFVEELVLLTARWVVSLDDVLQIANGPRVLVFRAGCSYRSRLEQLLHSRGVTNLRLMEYGTLEGILGCVGAGMGISLMPRGVVDRHLQDGRIRAHTLDPEDAYAETIFVRRRNTTPSAALTRFMDHVLDDRESTVLQMIGSESSAPRPA